MAKLVNFLYTVNKALAVIVVLILLLFLGQAAFADVGFAYKMTKEIHPKQKGRIKVMVIDSGIAPHYRNLRYIREEVSIFDGVSFMPAYDYQDNKGHGTHVSGIVLYGQATSIEDFGKDPVCDEVELISCRAWPFIPGLHVDYLSAGVNCINTAIEKNVDIINYSGGGLDYNEKEFAAIKAFSDGGGVFVAAAGNERSDLNILPYYPASYLKQVSGMIVVGSLQSDKKSRMPSSNYGLDGMVTERGEGVLSTLPGDRYGLMSGTSQAAPAVTHELLIKACEELKNKRGKK